MNYQPDLFHQPPQERLAEHHIFAQKLFSPHYLAFRLPQQTAIWQTIEADAQEAFDQIKQAYREMDAVNQFEAKNEAETERVFIRPALDALGFHIAVQPSLTGYGARRRPDCALFADRESYEGAQQDRDNQRHFYGHAVAIAEAKYWNRPMNDPDPGDPADTSDATTQLASYLRDVAETTDGTTNWGILTNGNIWRLFHRHAGYTAENYIEIDLEAIIQNDNWEGFKYFYALFSRRAFVIDPNEGIPWLESYLNQSELYSRDITERLKELIFERVFDGLAEGFIHYRREQQDIHEEDESSKRAIYQGCLTFLYRLLFLLNAESRQLLPMDNEGYRRRSLRKLIEDVWEERGEPRDPTHDFDYWHRLERLFQMMDEGATTFNLPKYNGGLFRRPDPDTPLEDLDASEIGAWFLESHQLSDPFLQDAIAELTFDPDRPDPNARAFIDYSSLDVRHLGEIYEGLLEFKIEIAEQEPICAVGSRQHPQWKPQSQVADGDTVLVTKDVGQPYITNDKGERKATGSYYTPHHIVQYIVHHTIGPQLDRFARDKQWHEQIEESDADLQALHDEIMAAVGDAEDRELWEGCRNDEERRQYLRACLDPQWGEHGFDPAVRALDLNVLDPAMGSGHFLVHAVDVIAERVALFLNDYPDSRVATELGALRKDILENVHRQQVEIAEESLSDVNLIKRMVMKRCVYGVDLNPMAVELAKLSLWLDSFTVGAPLSFLDHHLKWGNSLIGTIDVSDYLLPGTPREQEFQRAVSNLLAVAELSDATVSEVEQSQELHYKADTRLEPHRRRANVETAQHFTEISQNMLWQLQRYAYEEDLTAEDADHATRVDKLKETQNIAMRQRFFHWELEFPEVWYTKQGKRTNAGFDAVIGNPPYVRQEQLRGIKNYYRATYDAYDSVADLYVYFYERSHQLLRENGRFGMITSNKFMRAAYGKPLRRYLGTEVAVQRIIDFGDLPVFPGISAYPCILLSVKGINTEDPVRYLRVADFDYDDLDEALSEDGLEVPRDGIAGESWHLVDMGEQRLLEKMEQVSVSLKQWLGHRKINYGIKTGLNEAFFIDETTKDQLIKQDSKSAEIIKALVIGDDIGRYEIEYENRFLIFTRQGTDIDRYPAVKAYLEPYRQRLEPKPDHWDDVEDGTWPGRKAGSYKWFEIQDTIDYHEDFENPKIIYPVIAARNTFAFDNKGYYSNDKTFIIPEADHYCQALLNSQIGFTWAKNELSWLRGGFLEYRAQSMEGFPIRRILFTTPAPDREAQLAQLTEHYRQGEFELLLDAADKCLPTDGAEFAVFERSIPVKRAIDSNLLTADQAEALGLSHDDPSGYDINGETIERSDVVHDLLDHLAREMTRLKTERRDAVERFWTDLEGVTEHDKYEKLCKGKQERTLANRSEACAAFVDPESRNSRSLDASLSWNEEAFKDFAKILAGQIPNLSDLVDVYRAYASEVQDFDRQLERTDGLIDQIVYRLYGLTDDEIRIVEGT